MYSEWQMDKLTRSTIILICSCSQCVFIKKVIVTRVEIFWRVIDKISPYHFWFMVSTKNFTVYL